MNELQREFYREFRRKRNKVQKEGIVICWVLVAILVSILIFSF